MVYALGLRAWTVCWGYFHRSQVLLVFLFYVGANVEGLGLKDVSMLEIFCEFT